MIYKIKLIIFCLKNKLKFIRGQIGKNSRIRREKMSLLEIGNHFGVGDYCIFNVRKNSHLKIGTNFGCNRNVYISCREKIEIGNNVIIGPNTIIIDNNHDYKDVDFKNKYNTDPIKIGNNVWIGANVIILPGTIIEDDCVVGAGTTVRGKFDKGQLIYNKKETCVKKIR